jgi:DNA replication protein DnaC
LPTETAPRWPLQAAEILGAIGVPEAYRGFRLEAFDGVEAPAWDMGGVLIRGPVGVGKSCLASALLRARLRPDHPRTLAQISDGGLSLELPSAGVRWVRSQMILFAARGAFRDGGRSEESIIDEHVKRAFLVIDDLCSGKTTDTGWTIITEIIAQRIERRRDTVVTTNLTLEEIHQAEPRLASRLAALEEIWLRGGDRRVQL